MPRAAPFMGRGTTVRGQCEEDGGPLRRCMHGTHRCLPGCPGVVLSVHNQVNGADAGQSGKGGKLGGSGFGFCVLLAPHTIVVPPLSAPVTFLLPGPPAFCSCGRQTSYRTLTGSVFVAVVGCGEG